MQPSRSVPLLSQNPVRASTNGLTLAPHVVEIQYDVVAVAHSPPENAFPDQGRVDWSRVSVVWTPVHVAAITGRFGVLNVVANEVAHASDLRNCMVGEHDGGRSGPHPPFAVLTPAMATSKLP